MTRLIVGLMCVVATGASAQGRAPKQPVQRVDFSDVDMDGTVKKPEVVLMSYRPDPKFKNQIKMRMDFADKLRESAEEL